MSHELTRAGSDNDLAYAEQLGPVFLIHVALFELRNGFGILWAHMLIKIACQSLYVELLRWCKQSLSWTNEETFLVMHLEIGINQVDRRGPV
jgi:hypothetical protein